jgi:hypothetical protein
VTEVLGQFNSLFPGVRLEGLTVLNDVGSVRPACQIAEIEAGMAKDFQQLLAFLGIPRSDYQYRWHGFASVNISPVIEREQLFGKLDSDPARVDIAQLPGG